MSAAILQGVIVTTHLAYRTVFARPEKNERNRMRWLPDMDLNHDKQIQSLLCYHYTIGQPGVWRKVRTLLAESSR